MMFVILLLLPSNNLNVATNTNANINTYIFGSEDRFHIESSELMLLEDAILEAKSLLVSLGVPEINLCRTVDTKITISTNQEGEREKEIDDHHLRHLPLCNDQRQLNIEKNESFTSNDEETRTVRLLQEEEEPTLKENIWYFVGVLVCVLTAALAAGLTMGMLSIDPLLLLVKIRAAHSQEEKEQAEALLPIIKQHHLLLVTLLLLNSIANEALPLFLENLVSPFTSVLLSVTFLLIFGEILPTAIFTGPKKLKLASSMVPIVKGVMFITYPISYPIAKVLDKYLHDEEGNDGGAFNRGEISALVRIQHEERIANKRQRKLERMGSVRFDKSDKRRNFYDSAKNHKSESSRFSLGSLSDVQSIHMDEVMMVEGALQMKTKTAMDVFTSIHIMFAVPENLILNEENVVDIYSSGYSRIPVYEQDPIKPKSQTLIKGILITKHLIVVNMSEGRPLLTMPLLIPPCVSPKMNLVELVNLFQTGRSGHFALVCARPNIGNTSLKKGDAIPAAAGIMGIVTLEDVLEELLQEEIYDENDRMEKEAEKIAIWVGKKWKCLKEKREREAAGVTVSMASAVVAAIDPFLTSNYNNATNESRSLLQTNNRKRQKENSGLLGSIFQSFGMNKFDSES